MPEPPFSVRTLAASTPTISHARHAVYQASPEANLVLWKTAPQPPTFPPLCPHCNHRADASLTLQRYFPIYEPSGDDSPNTTHRHIEQFVVPFCQTCVEQHRAEQRPLSPFLPIMRILSSGEGLGGLAVLVVAGLFFTSAIERLSLFPIFLGCLPLAIGFWLIRNVWNQTRYAAVPEPTPTALAVDFTPDLSDAFEPSWRAFQFRSAFYADAFRQANTGQLWFADSPEAKEAAAKRRRGSQKQTWFIWLFLAAVALYWLWDEVIHPYLWPYIHDYFTR